MTSFERQILRLKGSEGRRFESILFSRTLDFAFTGGAGSLKTEQIRLGQSGFRLSKVTSTGHRIALGEDNDVTLLVPRCGQLGVSVAGRVNPALPTRPRPEAGSALGKPPDPGMAGPESLWQGKLTSVELTNFYLSRIARHDEGLRAFLDLNPAALDEAWAADAAIRDGRTWVCCRACRWR